MALKPCDPSSAFFGFMGVTAAVVFANLGAAYGTAKSGVGISSMGVMRPDMVMRSIIPVVSPSYPHLGMVDKWVPPYRHFFPPNKCRTTIWK